MSEGQVVDPRLPDGRSPQGAHSDTVELTLPVRADLVALARFAAATIASRADFDVEEIEDLRLAVDELCISVADAAADGRLQLRFQRDDDQIEVECVFVRSPDALRAEDGDRTERHAELSRRIVEALVDVHGQDTQGGHPRAWLRKRRAPRPR